MADTTDPTELWNTIRAMQIEINELKFRPVVFSSASEAMEALDLQFRATNDAGDVRTIMSAVNLLEEFGVSAHFAGFAPDGSPTMWIDADTGRVFLANVSFNETVLLEALMTLNQLGNILQQTATVGSETRVLQVGMQDNGSGVPEGIVGIFEPFPDVIAVPNGNFATGDMTDWSTLVGEWSVVNGVATGKSLGQNPSARNDGFAVVGGNTYAFGCTTSGNLGILLSSATNLVSIVIKTDVSFYSAEGAALLGTSNVTTRSKSVSNAPYNTMPFPRDYFSNAYLIELTEQKNIKTPVGATWAEIRSYVSSVTYSGGTLVFSEDTSTYSIGISISNFVCVEALKNNMLRFRDDGIYVEQSGGGTEFKIIPSAGNIYESGAYYTMPLTTNTITALALTANRQYAIPIHINKQVAIASLDINVSTLASAKTAQVALYMDVGGGIDTAQLVFSSAEVSVATVGVKSFAAGIVVDPGLYYLAVQSNGAPQVSGAAVTASQSVLGYTALPSTRVTCKYRATTYGDWSNGAWLNLTTTNPLVWIKIS